MRLASSPPCQRSVQPQSITPSSLRELCLLVKDWQKMLTQGIHHQSKLSSQELILLNGSSNSVIIRLLWLKVCEEQGRYQTRSSLQWFRYWPCKEQFDAFFQQTLCSESFQDAKSHVFKSLNKQIRDVNSDGFKAVLQQVETIRLRPLIVKKKGPFGLAAGLLLDHVYSYLLGHPIGTHRPERKLKGCYYTPLDVVDCMVRQTLEPQLERLLVDPVTIVDPACGAGIFLTVIYQQLLNWYTAQSSPEALTFETKKQILLHHIYGVDLDPQAVEVARLALVLVLLGDESFGCLGHHDHDLTLDGSLEHKDWANNNIFPQLIARILAEVFPGLSRNIQWGNTLVGEDINQEMSLSDEQCDRIRPFNWQTAFPHIFPVAPLPEQQESESPIARQQGFDIVIGNPPYIDAESMSRYQPEERQYCSTHYATASGNWDIFCVFCEKALQLCRIGGLSSFIVPNKLASANYAQAVRHLLSIENQLLYIRDYSSVAVFPISVYPLVYVVKKEDSLPERQAKRSSVEWERVVSASNTTSGTAPNLDMEIEQRSLPYTHFRHPQRPWAIAATTTLQTLTTRMRQQGIPLGQIATVVGAATVAEAYALKPYIQEKTDVEYIHSSLESNTDAAYFRFVNSGTIDPYCFLWNQKPLRYLKSRYQAPVISFCSESQIPSKRWQQAQAAKIIIAGMTLRLECALDHAGQFFPGKSTTIIRLESNALCDLRYLLAILNSRLMSTYYRTEFGGNTLNGGYLRIGPPQIKPLPICMGSEDQQSTIIRLVDELHGTQESSQAQARRDITHRIDQQIYELYHLSACEIDALEGVE